MVLQVPGQSHNHYLILSSHSLSHQRMTVIVSVLLSWISSAEQLHCNCSVVDLFSVCVLLVLMDVEINFRILNDVRNSSGNYY